MDAGRVVRDTATKLTPETLGGILNGFVVFQNADRSGTRGVDLEVKSRFKLQNLGQLGANLTWTHLQRQRVITEAGDVHDYAGTHGNCEITNCIGSPKTKVSLALSLDMGQWRLVRTSTTAVACRTSWKLRTPSARRPRPTALTSPGLPRGLRSPRPTCRPCSAPPNGWVQRGREQRV